MNPIQVTRIGANFSIISEFMPHIPSAALGLFINHGSRNESKENQGICHLIEHMLFKGTKTKSAQDISSLVESAGAVIDGFITKETSGIYCRYPVDKFDLMVHLIGELISQSTFDKTELEREKNIIEAEIKESEDDPHEQVFNLLFEVLFYDHPFAHSIAGKIETVRSITKERLEDYFHNHFLKSKVCISAAGNINHTELVEKLTRKSHILHTMNQPVVLTPPLERERTFLIQERSDLTQIHVAAASFTYGYSDPRRYALIIVNNILGGTMSSRFFQRLREQEGLVYTISSFVDFYSDIGLIGGYYITDANQYDQTARAGLNVAIHLKQDGVTDEEFERSINYSKAMVAINAENPMSRMIRNAQNQIILDKTITVEESIVNYDRLTKEEVNQATEQLRPDKHSVAIIGPAKQVEESMNKLARTGKIIIKN